LSARSQLWRRAYPRAVGAVVGVVGVVGGAVEGVGVAQRVRLFSWVTRKRPP
jgi:hypothetical protein